MCFPSASALKKRGCSPLLQDVFPPSNNRKCRANEKPRASDQTRVSSEELPFRPSKERMLISFWVPSGASLHTAFPHAEINRHLSPFIFRGSPVSQTPCELAVIAQEQEKSASTFLERRNKRRLWFRWEMCGLENQHAA